MLSSACQTHYHIAAIFAAHWIEFIVQYKRWIRPVVFENVFKVLACRSPILGCHIYRCLGCGHTELVVHSCKSRFCPTCGKHATDIWADQVLNRLLDVPYHHLVMSIPRQLRIVILMNRKHGLDLLVRAGCEARLKKRWKYQVTTLMKKAHREGQWRFPKSKSFLKHYPNFASILNKLRYVTWYAHIGASLLDPRFSVQYIGRYTKRAVMAEYRIRYYDGKLIRFSFKDYAEGGKTGYMTLKVMTFIGRIIRHIPDRHFPMIRYAGLFCNRWKKQYLAQARSTLNQAEDSEPVPSPTWPERQAEYKGTDPLICPNCNKQLTLAGSFFGSWKALQDRFKDAGKDTSIASCLLRPG